MVGLKFNFIVWSDYVGGFGSPDGEYWIGLEPIHILTEKLNKKRLRIDMVAPNGRKYYIVYNNFYVQSSAYKYRMYTGTKAEGTASDQFR